MDYREFQKEVLVHYANTAKTISYCEFDFHFWEEGGVEWYECNFIDSGTLTDDMISWDITYFLESDTWQLHVNQDSHNTQGNTLDEVWNTRFGEN